MPLSAQLLKDRIQDQVARDNDEEFFRLLTAADERLLNMGRWRWTRAAITLVPDAANAPTKFNITRSGYTDEATGELVYNYTITCRVTPGSLVAVNS